MEQYSRRVVERAETLDGVVAGREFGVWVENLLNVAEVCDLDHLLLTVLDEPSFRQSTT